jgi:hypothetical protein
MVFLTLSDGTDSVQTMIVVNVTSDWVPELIEELPDIVLMENSTLYNVFNLDDFFSDRDQDMIFFTSGNDNIIITINENNTVDITAPPQWSGTEMVTFRARDPTGAIAEDTILVTVLEVNDGPEIAGIPNLVVHYDYAYSFDLSPYIYDPDNLTSELLAWTSESTEFIRIQQNNNLGLLINYPELLNGMTIPVTIYVSDGLITDSITIDITVSQYFPPELITNVPDVYFDEDTVLINAFVLSDYFLDIDSSILFYSNGSKNINVTINKDLSVDFSAPENWYGSEVVTFRATDSQGALAEDKILVYVVPVNDRPTIESIPWQEKDSGDQWVLDISEFIDDVDNEKSELIISVNSANSPGSVTLVGHVLIFNYPKGINDDFITVTVSDGELEASSGFIVNINKEKLPPSIWELIPWSWVFSTIFVATITGYAIYRKKTGYKVFEAFLIHEKGLSVAHASVVQRSEMEDVIVSGMFTAVQDFIGDTFSDKTSDEWELDEMKFGENKILIERSQKLFLAVIFEGNGDRLRMRVKKLLYDVNKEYGSVFSKWDGDMNKIAGINLILMGLISKRKVKSQSSEELLPARKPEPLIDESQKNLKELDEFITLGTDLTKLKIDENVTDLDNSAIMEKCVCAVCGIDVSRDTAICPNCKCRVSESDN